MRARYYLPLIDRFISRDPAGGGVNPYVYAGDSPTNSTDPTGMDQAGGWAGEDVASGCSYGGGCCANDLPSAYPPGTYFPGGTPLPPQTKIPGNSIGIPGSGGGAISYGGGRVLPVGELFTPESGGIPDVDPEAAFPGGFNGHRNFELSNPKYQGTRNEPATINGRSFSDHALDEMQNRGIPPSVIENTINEGIQTPGRFGRVQYYDPANNVTVIVDPVNGTVVTARFGPPGEGR